MNASIIWKRGPDWIQFNPPRNHPSKDEWLKLKEKKDG